MSEQTAAAVDVDVTPDATSGGPAEFPSEPAAATPAPDAGADPSSPTGPEAPPAPASPPETPAAAPPTAPDWRDGLPDDIANHALVREAPDLASLAKQAIDMQSYQGQSIRIPSEHASAEEQAAFREKLRQHVPNLVEADLSNPEAAREFQRRMGLPEEASGYQRPSFEAPDGVELDYSMLDTFQPIAHKYGLTQAQFEGIAQEITAGNVAAGIQAQQAHIESMEGLQKEWGYAFESKMRNVRAVAGILSEHIPGFDAERAGASTLRALDAIAERLGPEGSSLSNEADGSGGQPVMTPREAEARRQEILRNREHPYWRAEDPDHQRSVTEFTDLTRLALGPDGKRPQTILPTDVDQGGGLHYEGTV